MGFDITGLNPKNIKVKNPKCPKDLFQGCSKEEEKKYFDDLGKYQEQKGTYFRNNVWWWRPLAHYVLEYTKVINEDKKKIETIGNTTLIPNSVIKSIKKI